MVKSSLPLTEYILACLVFAGIVVWKLAIKVLTNKPFIRFVSLMYKGCLSVAELVRFMFFVGYGVSLYLTVIWPLH